MINITQKKFPYLSWRQKSDNVYITINVIHTKAPSIIFSDKKLKYSGSDGYFYYEFEIELYEEVFANQCQINRQNRYITLILKKKRNNEWKRLIKENKRVNWIQTDWNYYTEDDQNSEEEEHIQNISSEQNNEKANNTEEVNANISPFENKIENKNRNFANDIEYLFIKHFNIDEKILNNSNIFNAIKDKEKNIDKSETILRMFLLLLSKTYENNDNYNEKYEFLKEMDEMLDSDLCIFFHEIKKKINDTLYEKIKKIIVLMGIIGDYDYIIYRYIKCFGDNPNIFIEIFSILYECYFRENCKFFYNFENNSKDVYQQMYEYIEKKVKKK